MEVPKRRSKSGSRNFRSQHRSRQGSRSNSHQGTRSRRRSSSRQASSRAEANISTTSPETSFSSHQEENRRTHRHNRQNRSRSRSKSQNNIRELDDKREEMLKQRSSRRRPSTISTRRSSAFKSKQRSSKMLMQREEEEERRQQEEEKLQIVSKLVRRMKTDDLEVIGSLLDTNKQQYSDDEDEESASVTRTKKSKHELKKKKKSKGRKKKSDGRMEKFSAWFQRLSMTKKYGFVACITVSVTAILAILIILITLAAKTIVKANNETTKKGVASTLDIIKYAPLLTGNVTIGTLKKSPTNEDYYLNINFVNFSIFDEQDLVLYITRGSRDTLEDAMRQNSIRYPRIALLSLPLKLPSNFWPGEYNGILLSDESEDGRKIELVQSTLEVLDDVRDFLQPSGSPTSSMTPTDLPSVSPTDLPSGSPTLFPTYPPSFEPSQLPSSSPTTGKPSVSPTNNPTTTPRPTTLKSELPTSFPSQSPTANDRITRLQEILGSSMVSTGDSPQARAVQWLDTGSQVSLKTSEGQALQLYALVVLHFATTPSQWNLDTTKSSMCNWTPMVTCNTEGDVVQLDLQTLELQGPVMTELGYLTSLATLNLYNNRLVGEIPTELNRLTGLRVLRVDNNRLTGPIPDISRNQENPLQVLNLANNAGLTGNLESIVNTLPRSVEEFSCQGCALAGQLPIALRSFQNLRTLDLQEVGLGGTIPSTIASMAALRELYLRGNQLVGQIHSRLGTMENLQVLDLSSNQFSGELRTELGSLSALKTLNLSRNAFLGVVPTEIISLPSLQDLDLSSNELVGPLPRLTGYSLTSVNFSENPGISGNIGTIFNGASDTLADFACAQCSLQGGSIPVSIQTLKLEAAGLSGPIGTFLSRLSLGNLRRLEIGNNSLTGQIPSQLFSNQRLEVVRLNHNLLVGSIPSFPSGASLTMIDMSNNPGLVADTTTLLRSLPSSTVEFRCNNCTLKGMLTDSALSTLSNLKILELENAGIGGNMPDALGRLTGLTSLNLVNNALVGTIPETLMASSIMKNFHVAKNLLSSSVNSFTGTSLEILSLDENLSVTGSLDVFFSSASETLAEFYCGKCSISGTVPGQLLGRLSNLRALKLEQAGLGGFIPTQLGLLSKLTSLELGFNGLEGSIPEAVADLPELVKIVLYKNKLEGDLPLFSSKSLQVINLSDNIGLRANIGAFLNTLPSQSVTEIMCEDCILGGTLSTSIASFSNLEALRIDKGGAIAGSLPTELGLLTKLTLLDMSDNALTGVIPTQFGLLRALTRLDLELNFLRGSIPAELGDISSLVELDLGFNGFNGRIPQPVAALPALRDLDLAANKLTGQLPLFTGESLLYITLDEGGDLEGNLRSIFENVNKNLLSFSCEGCNLAGSIPPNFLSEHSSLEYLRLEDCDLVGDISNAFGNLVNLTTLALGENQLVGQIPTQLLQLYSLEVLELFGNSFAGSLPVLKSLPNLRILDLASNNKLIIDAFTVFPTLPSSLKELYFDGIPLQGTLPFTGISALPSLEYLGIENCNVYGRMPLLDGLENITSLRFGGNSLSGTIPSTMGQLSKLEVLELWSNALFGTIPSFAGNRNSLREIDLSFNTGITESLRDVFSKMPDSLEDFRCEECGLTGSIPGGNMLRFKNFTAIQVEANSLTGTLPTEFGSLTMMSRLSIGNNGLIGSIPQQIANLPQLEIFDIWGNLLTGTVPSFAPNDGYLKYFDIEETQLRGSLKGLITSLPPESLEKFYAGYTLLTGFIPSDIASFPLLRVFNIRFSNIGGTVPFEMSYMNRLEVLDIEGNAIGGTFPLAIVQLRNLEDLSIHANKIRGSLEAACDNRVPDELTADCSNPTAVSCSCCSACWSQNTNAWD